MSKFILEIDTGNASMVYPCQIARALKEVAGKITDMSMHDLKRAGTRKIMDSNGNSVGSWRVE